MKSFLLKWSRFSELIEPWSRRIRLHSTTVTAPCGQFSQEGLEAVYFKAIRGTASHLFPFRRGRGFCGFDRISLPALLIELLIVKEKRREPFPHMILYGVGEHTQKDVCPHMILSAVMDRSHEKVYALHTPDRTLYLCKPFIGIGIARESIYIDPLIQPISTNTTKGVMAMDSPRGIKGEIPGVHTICGLSNISFGLPQRKIINRTFLTLLISAGLDAAIIDPLDDKIMAVLKIAEMLIGNDEYCANYLKGVRAGQIVS